MPKLYTDEMADYAYDMAGRKYKRDQIASLMNEKWPTIKICKNGVGGLLRRARLVRGEINPVAPITLCGPRYSVPRGCQHAEDVA